jgi:hypothetical protein
MHPVLEWQATAGGQIDSDSHGDVNLGLRTGPWTFVLRTDAPEITWAPSDDRGRAWVTARGHAFAAAMLISPWTDGAPDPGRARRASSVGIEAGGVRYGPAGLYVGGRAAFDGVFLGPTAAGETGAPHLVTGADLIAGWWRPDVSAWARGGADLDVVSADATLSPHLAAELHWNPRGNRGSWAIAPRVEVWAGLAEDQGELVRARLGGLNPWVVPLAGAAWAEWWVEDYAVARLGGTVGPGTGETGLRASPFVDLAAFDGQEAAGFGLGVRGWRRRAFVDVTGGWAPWIAREPGVSRVSVWFSLGLDWGAGSKPASDRVPGPPGTSWPG